MTAATAVAQDAKTTTANAKMPRVVMCAYCSTEYVYGPGCTPGGLGHLFSHNGFVDREPVAEKKKSAADQLGGPDDAIPCPKCYRYQPHQCLPMAMKQYGWVRVFYIPAALAAVLGLALAIFAGKTPTRLVGSVVGMIGVGGLWATGRVQNKLIDGYDANVKPEWERAALAGDKAMLLTDFKRMNAEQTDASYRAHLVRTAGQPSPEPYVINVWFKDEEITPGATVPVKLPTGKKAEFILELPVAAGNTYRLHSEWGEDLPFTARVCIFSRVA
jgi:hypothetical protein